MSGMDDQQECSEYRFEFDEGRKLAVLICDHVAGGAPILYVTHEGEGEWQFLCGGDHSDDDEPKVVGLGRMVAEDPSLNALAELHVNHSAERGSPTSDWVVIDDAEDGIREQVAEHGWSVMSVEAGDEPGEPPFSYTVGLFETFEHPELIVVGLPQEHALPLLNTAGELIRAGSKFVDGQRSDKFMEGFDMVFRGIRDAVTFGEYFGYAQWYYGPGEFFPALQILWPDEKNKYPGEGNTAEEFDARQPLLP